MKGLPLNTPFSSPCTGGSNAITAEKAWHTGKINGRNAVQDDENVGIGQLLEAKVEAGGKHENQHLQIETHPFNRRDNNKNDNPSI